MRLRELPSEDRLRCCEFRVRVVFLLVSLAVTASATVDWQLITIWTLAEQMPAMA